MINDLACDFGVCMILIMTYHLFCTKICVVLHSVVILYISLIESYYFLCVKKTKEQLYQNRCLLISTLFVITYLGVQNIPQCLK